MPSTSYQITITGANPTAPGDGFIDNKSVREYISGGTEPTTLALSTAKSRGNARWAAIIARLHAMTNIYVSGVTPTGATINAPATTITFVALVEQGNGNLRTPDENNVGQFLTGAAALRRVVARALSAAAPADVAEIYDPTATTGVNAVAHPRFGIRVIDLVTGPVAANLTAAEAMVTVTAI